MKNHFVLKATIAFLLCGISVAFGQTVSEEAKRHFDRGVAAVEMAKSPNDYAAAINEFEQAARLAPDWPDVYYNLGKVQDAAEKYGDAARSFREYLRLAPDAEEIKSLINKLEYKAEQVLTIPQIVDILVSFNSEGWQSYYRDDAGILQKTKASRFEWLNITRVDDHSVRYKRLEYKYAQTGQVRDVFYETQSVAGPKIRLLTISSVYLDKKNIGLGTDSNDIEIEVISRNHVKLHISTEIVREMITVDTHEAYYEIIKMDPGTNAGNAAANNPTAPTRPPTGAGNINVNNESADADQMVDLLSGNKKEAVQLLAQGADVNIKNKDGQTPLHVAIQRVDKEVVEFLISKGADINAKNNGGQTPLNLALQRERSNMADLLRKHGAK